MPQRKDSRSDEHSNKERVVERDNTGDLYPAPGPGPSVFIKLAGLLVAMLVVETIRVAWFLAPWWIGD